MIINRYLKWSPGHSETIGTASGCLSLPFFASERGHRCGTRRGATCAAREVRDALLKDASSCAMSSTQLSSPSETGWCTLTTLQGHGHDPKWDSKTVYPAIFGCFRLRVFPLYCLNIQFRIVAGSFWVDCALVYWLQDTKQIQKGNGFENGFPGMYPCHPKKLIVALIYMLSHLI